MAESILREKSKEFAKQIIFLCRKLKANKIEASIVNQLLRCGTSVGANVYEAQFAQGPKDFISKLEIAQKECSESVYWLELLYETDSMPKEEYEKLSLAAQELCRIIASSVITMKKNDSKEA